MIDRSVVKSFPLFEKMDDAEIDRLLGKLPTGDIAGTAWRD